MKRHNTLRPKRTFIWPALFSVFLSGTYSPGSLDAAGAQQPAEPRPRATSPAESPQRPLVPPGRQPGYLGVVTDDRADRGAGVRIVQLLPDSPAAQGGLRVGDLIVSIDRRPVRSMADLAAIVTASEPNTLQTFEIRRGEETVVLGIRLGRRPAPGERPYRQFGRIPQPTEPPPPSPDPLQPRRQGLLGVRTVVVTAEARRFLGLPTFRGALIVEVIVGSPAQQAGIPLNALIVAVDGRLVANPADLAQLVARAGAGRVVELAYYAGSQLVRRQIKLDAFTSRAALARPSVPGEAPPRLLPREPIPTEIPLPSPEVTREAAPQRPSAVAPMVERLDALEQRINELERLVRRLLDAKAEPDG